MQVPQPLGCLRFINCRYRSVSKYCRNNIFRFDRSYSVIAHPYTVQNVFTNRKLRCLKSGNATVHGPQKGHTGLLHCCGSICGLTARFILVQVPQLGCLHFNNCKYVAHEMVTLAYSISAAASAITSIDQAKSPGLQTDQTEQLLEVASELNATGQRYLDQQVGLAVMTLL